MFKWLFKKKGCAKHMNNKLEVIGIDHGWSMMKTISQVFVTGVNAPDVVVTTLKLVNVPTEPKLPQTGDNANPLLYLGIGALALITGVGVGLRGRKKKNK